MIAWAAGIGVANGTLREVTYGKRLDESDANRLSALTAIAAFAAYFWRLHRRWPISGSAEALRIGGVWLILHYPRVHLRAVGGEASAREGRT